MAYVRPRASWHAIAVSLLAGVIAAGCVSGAPRERFSNVGQAFERTATAGDWTRHLVRMAAGTYPGRDALPDDHGLAPATAAAMLRDSAAAPRVLTWFGHSTFLLRLGGVTVMTDPVLFDHVGTGPFRLRRLAPALPDPALIERVDAVVVSHADFDHLDMPSLGWLADRFPNAVLYVPEGTARLVGRLPFARIVELPWYGSDRLGGVAITAVPAIHGVRRPPFGIDSMHWAGYVIEGAGRRVYFSGDTGAGTVFADIRRKLGRVDLAIVPAGAWAPRDFQAPYHVDPEEAIAIAETLGARRAIAMHWGTFALSPDPPEDQRARFLAAGTRQTRADVMRIGETIPID